MKRLILTALFVVSLSLSLFAQSNIISREEADKLYGPPVKSIEFHSRVLLSLLDTHEYIMFRIRDDRVNILGRNRQPVILQFPTKEDDVYYVFEAKTLMELIKIGGAKKSYIELRTGAGANLKGDNTITDGEETVTVTNGVLGLVPIFWCPPDCQN